jgi:hypothetical protein
MSSQQSGEGEIRRNMVQADVVECMVAHARPTVLEHPDPGCLWFLSRDKGAASTARIDRRGQMLFIDARKAAAGASAARRSSSPTRTTGGRAATTGVILGDYALSVGMPSSPLPDDWRWTRLTDVARLETGHTPSRKHPEYWGGDIPWIGIRDATANHGGTLYWTNQSTNELGIANSSARVLPENTVCLSRTASVGYVVVMGRPMATSQDFVNWVCSSALDFRYLKYVLLAERESFLRFASGTTPPAATPNSPSRGRVKIPQLSARDGWMVTRSPDGSQPGSRLPSAASSCLRT